MLPPIELSTLFNIETGEIAGRPVIARCLSDLHGVFADEREYERMLKEDDRVVYTVSSLDNPVGEGDLHCGLGRIMPGCVGNEYFMTKGHLHSWRPAAECYVGLSGKGIMLIEDEEGETTRWCDLAPYTIVYVPGRAAHRTVNVGQEPLVYLGIYPATAGHDYTPIARKNFRQMVLRTPDGPSVIMRSQPSNFPAEP